MTKKSENIPWYDGVPLLEYLEMWTSIRTATKGLLYAGTACAVRTILSVDSRGQIEAGTIHVGDSITTLPSNETALLSRHPHDGQVRG